MTLEEHKEAFREYRKRRAGESRTTFTILVFDYIETEAKLAGSEYEDVLEYLLDHG